MMSRGHVGYLAAALAIAVLSCSLFGCACSLLPSHENTVVEIDTGTSDQMYEDEVTGLELYVFQIDGAVLTTDYFYDINVGGEPLRDGGFYRIVVDATLLNGGVAGYVDYPEISHVTSCEEISPLEMGLSPIESGAYGLSLIGDYADGDVLLNLYSVKGVWKDGSWVYRYDDEIELPGGTQALVRDGVSESDVQAGIEADTLSCEDYFILPEA